MAVGIIAFAENPAVLIHREIWIVIEVRGAELDFACDTNHYASSLGPGMNSGRVASSLPLHRSPGVLPPGCNQGGRVENKSGDIISDERKRIQILMKFHSVAKAAPNEDEEQKRCYQGKGLRLGPGHSGPHEYQQANFEPGQNFGKLDE